MTRSWAIVFGPVVGIFLYHAVCILECGFWLGYVALAPTPGARLKRSWIFGNTQMGVCLRLLAFMVLSAWLLGRLVQTICPGSSTGNSWIATSVLVAAAVGGLAKLIPEFVRRFVVPKEASLPDLLERMDRDKDDPISSNDVTESLRAEGEAIAKSFDSTPVWIVVGLFATIVPMVQKAADIASKAHPDRSEASLQREQRDPANSPQSRRLAP